MITFDAIDGSKKTPMPTTDLLLTDQRSVYQLFLQRRCGSREHILRYNDASGRLNLFHNARRVKLTLVSQVKVYLEVLGVVKTLSHRDTVFT